MGRSWIRCFRWPDRIILYPASCIRHHGSCSSILHRVLESFTHLLIVTENNRHFFMTKVSKAIEKNRGGEEKKFESIVNCSLDPLAF
jgi:hypothetical protein